MLGLFVVTFSCCLLIILELRQDGIRKRIAFQMLTDLPNGSARRWDTADNVEVCSVRVYLNTETRRDPESTPHWKFLVDSAGVHGVKHFFLFPQT